MSIPITKYVDITSGVGAAAAVPARELIGRIFSDNPLTPAGSVLEFSSAALVGAYYGTTSEEYKRAVFYFGFVSKSISRPKNLGFARWAKAAAPARIYGAKLTATLPEFVAVAAGTLSITVGAQTAALVAIDLSGAASLTAVAALLQTAVRAAAGSQFTTATVTYNAPASRFEFAASTPGAAGVSVVAGTLSGLLGWTSPVTILSPGVDVQTVSDALSDGVDASNNFGSFAFVEVLSTSEIAEAAAWNAARNVEFIYCARIPVADAATISAALIGLAGTGMTLAPLATQYPELVPMMILAATDYGRRGSVQNYMYQQAALTPSVTSESASDMYDALRVNYYGATQTAGQQIYFYQRGTLTGGDTAPVDMNVYANEIWLKDAAQGAMLALMLAVTRVPATDDGRGMILAVLQDPIEQALVNGTISIGKPLTTQQKAFISQTSGDADAWQQVQNIGYWAGCVIVQYAGPGGSPEFKAVYTLIYSKDDAVRKVEGSHVLI